MGVNELETETWFDEIYDRGLCSTPMGVNELETQVNMNTVYR